MINPFGPKIFTKIAVAKDDIPILNKRLPKTIAESKRVGLSNNLFIVLAPLYFCFRLRKFNLLKENIAVSEAEKKADKPSSIIKIKIL